MAWNFLSFFQPKNKKKTLENLEEKLVEEVNGLKKILRKQNIFLEAFKDEVIKGIIQNEIADLNPYIELADTFFYYEQGIGNHDSTSVPQQEARQIIWEKIDNLLTIGGLEMIRFPGERFNAQFFAVVENISRNIQDLVVVQVLQPGYLYQGNVIRPAKVVVGESPPEE
jgi:molecular chaperone GrpE (heat shock protein)